MTTPTEIRDDFRDFRRENRDDHQKIIDRLNHINGTVRRHDVELAKMAEIQNGHNRAIDRIEDSIKSVWKKVRALDMTTAKMLILMSVAASVAYGILSFVVVPLIKHVFFGGG